MKHRSHLYGVMGEFETAKHFLQAVAKVRDAGYRNMDAYAPFPLEGLSEAMGLRRSWVPLVTLFRRPRRRLNRLWIPVLGQRICLPHEYRRAAAQ